MEKDKPINCSNRNLHGIPTNTIDCPLGEIPDETMTLEEWRRNQGVFSGDIATGFSGSAVYLDGAISDTEFTRKMTEKPGQD